MKTLTTFFRILDKATKSGCEVTCGFQRGTTMRELRKVGGSHYFEIRKEETADCEAVNVTVRFSDHPRQLSAVTNHAAPTIETTDYGTTYVCNRLLEELEWLWR